MIQIGDSEIPNLTLSDAEEIISIIDERFDGSISPDEEEDLAAHLGHETADSGAFRSKLSDLKKYDLLEGWGEKELTPLAYNLLRGENEEVVENIYSNFGFFRMVQSHFGDSVPRYPEWGEFLEEELGIRLQEINQPKRAWKVYTDLARRASDQDEPQQEDKENTFDEERFQKYLDIADNHEEKRPYAIKALNNLAHDPAPSHKNIDEIIIRVEEDRYPSHDLELLQILKLMCDRNDNMSGERQQRIEELALDFITNIPSNPSRDDLRRVSKSIGILEELRATEDSPPWATDLWKTARDAVIQAAEYSDEWEEAPRLGNLADDIVSHLTGSKADWADESLKSDIEDDIWERIGESGFKDHHFKRWLNQLNVIV